MHALSVLLGLIAIGAARGAYLGYKNGENDDRVFRQGIFVAAIAVATTLVSYAVAYMVGQVHPSSIGRVVEFLMGYSGLGLFASIMGYTLGFWVGTDYHNMKDYVEKKPVHLRNWFLHFSPNGYRLRGEVYGDEEFPDGTRITTGRITAVLGRSVWSGQHHLFLGEPSRFYLDELDEQGIVMDDLQPLQHVYYCEVTL